MHRSGNSSVRVRCALQLILFWLFFLTAKFVFAEKRESAKNNANHSDTTLLTTASEVHALSADQARLGYPVQIEGVVTYFDPEQHFFFMQDHSDGIFVSGLQEQTLHAGQKIRVEGTTVPGDFAPSIGKPRVQDLGTENLPQPEIPSFDAAMSGKLDSRWVVLEGIVHPTRRDANDHILFDLYTKLGPITVHTPGLTDRSQLEEFVDAKVRLSGV